MCVYFNSVAIIFISINIKHKRELELEKPNNQLKILEEENKNSDKMIIGKLEK